MNEPINIHDYLPKFVLPEYTIFEDHKGFRVCLKDMRDNYSFDCQVFMFDEIVTHKIIYKHAWEDYFFMLMEIGVL